MKESMKLIFKLSKHNLKLSTAEVLSILQTKEHKLLDNFLIIDSKFDIDKVKRLAYTKSVYQLLFTSNKKNLINKIKTYNWKSIYKSNFCVQTQNSKQITSKTIADIIWNNLVGEGKTPKTKLKNSKTEIHFIFTKTKVIVAQLVSVNQEDFAHRKPHNRPELSPTSLDPRLARAMVNLSGAKLNNTILDPFCGVGGILIEWGLLGGKCIGYDINNIELKKCKINLKHYKIKTNQYKLINKDSLTIIKHYNYIVTDFPYGRNSKINKELKQLYSDFLKICKKTIKPKTIVVGVPNFINFKDIIKQTKQKNKYKIKHKFKIYIHKSLTKEVYVLE
tara:strand:- start:327 stop:1328 length:1002 start_codon:yes stop_codon:yes gene_type:complete